MTKKRFNELHRHQGGVKQLQKMIKCLDSLEKIGDHFDMSKTCVQHWCKILFGKNYDPRKERKKLIIEAMIEFAEKYSEELFEQTFKDKSKYYYYIVLSECYSKGIYKHE